MDFEDSLGWQVHKTDLFIKCTLNKVLKEFDITVEQYTVLSRLFVKDGINQKALAKKCIKDQAALTRILDILEKKGYVRRENAPNDRREFLIYITDMGKENYEKLYPKVKSSGEGVVSVLTKEELLILKTLLKKFNNHEE